MTSPTSEREASGKPPPPLYYSASSRDGEDFAQISSSRDWGEATPIQWKLADTLGYKLFGEERIVRVTFLVTGTPARRTLFMCGIVLCNLLIVLGTLKVWSPYFILGSLWIPLSSFTAFLLYSMSVVRESAFSLNFVFYTGLGVLYGYCVGDIYGWDDIRASGGVCSMFGPGVIYLLDGFPLKLKQYFRFPIMCITTFMYLYFAITIRCYLLPDMNERLWEFGTLGGISRAPIYISNVQLASELSITSAILSVKDLVHSYLSRKDGRALNITIQRRIVYDRDFEHAAFSAAPVAGDRENPETRVAAVDVTSDT